MTATRARSAGAVRDDSPGECFVYIQLPASTEVVTCGRFARIPLAGGEAAGRFIYGRTYLARPDAVSLDPYHLPLQPGWQETAKLNGVFGAIRDSAPDGWGQYVIERALGRADLTIVDFLLHSPEDRIGALSFGRGPIPPSPTPVFNRVLQLPELLDAASRIESDQDSSAGEASAAQVHQLLTHGSSALGGARPKNVVEDDEGLWVAKFPSRKDRWNNAAVEGAMLSLAGRCGIQVPQTRIHRVGEQPVLLIKRFDRETSTALEGARYLRYRMVSALTVLDAEDTVTDRRNWSYVLLADELQRWSHRPEADKRELFRRMVLNALVSNLDDHPRNHAFIAPRSDFRLAPAYDITPDPVHAIERRDLAMTCGTQGRAARRSNALSQAQRFALDVDSANRIINEMKATIAAHWESEVRRQGGSAADCNAIRRAFLYEGFEYA